MLEKHTMTDRVEKALTGQNTIPEADGAYS